MTQWSTQSAAELPLTELARLFTSGFAGYLIPMQMTADALAERVCGEDIHLGWSRVLLLDGSPVALALVALRGRESRLAAMGVNAPVRSRGAGRELLRGLLDDARKRGDRRMRLEVFESNAPARALYESAGFRTISRLVGWNLPAASACLSAVSHASAAGAGELREVEPTAFARQLARSEVGPLPWQVEPASLAAPPAAARCFELEEKAWAYVASFYENAVAVRGLLAAADYRRRGLGRRLLAALAAQF